MGRPNLIPIPRSGDWEAIRRAFQKLNIVLGQESSPVFNGAVIEADASIGEDLSVGGDLSLTGTLTLPGLTASRIVATNAGSGLESVSDLTSWIADAGTGNIIVADDSNGGVTLTTAQDILTTSTPTFAGAQLNGNLNIIGNITGTGILDGGSSI